MAEKKFYGMRNDYMFHAVLQKNESVLKHLLAALLEIDVSMISSCPIENPIILGENIDAKDCILDIKLKMNDNYIMNIELQIQRETYWTNRSLFYWAGAFRQMEEGEGYDALLPTYQIGILDFTLFEDRPKFLSKYGIVDLDDQYKYSDLLRIIVLELPQLDEELEKCEEETPLIKWAKIFKAETMEELEQIANGEEVLENMVSTLKELSQDEKIRRQCEAREDYARRMRTEYNAGVREGLEKGRELERTNTERERQRAEKAERELEELRKRLVPVD